MNSLSIYAVLCAAVSAFLLGGLWYSEKVFGRIWTREMCDPRLMNHRHPIKVFAISFVHSLLAALGFGLLIEERTLVHPSDLYGYALLISICFIATSTGINYQFANRSFKVWLIDAGYHCLQFLAYATIFVAWPSN